MSVFVVRKLADPFLKMCIFNLFCADTNWLESVFVLINGSILEIFSFFFYLKFPQLAHFTCILGFSPAAEICSMLFNDWQSAELMILNNSCVYLFQNTHYNFFQIHLFQVLFTSIMCDEYLFSTSYAVIHYYSLLFLIFLNLLDMLVTVCSSLEFLHLLFIICQHYFHYDIEKVLTWTFLIQNSAC